MTKKLFTAFMFILSMTGCATHTTSEQGLKKSPCACVFKPIRDADYNANIQPQNV
ncbi:hypothetical protein [Acinetobacter pollinis]|uniref:hypothetical protein n=1 Tax=Acinetobacter pollinis TaxID=2605270 RepID=UPI0018A2ECDE|nr:hypothetical protein [Acinetobacter pollinis]MBF7691174.1 hypothetical protein [Acinetobacter pollinis]MBF7698886.1 hypothetical protein [Acinetobacter pollinis]